MLAGLGGCAALPPPVEPAWLQGRMVVRVAAHLDQPERSDSAAFELRGSAERGELRLSTPLGTVMAVALWSPGSATLQTPSGRTAFDSLGELARRALGEELPLQALPDWLQGRPWPGAEHRAEAQGLNQLGWRIDLSRFGDGLLVAERDAPPVVTLRVRLER